MATKNISASVRLSDVLALILFRNPILLIALFVGVIAGTYQVQRVLSSHSRRELHVRRAQMRVLLAEMADSMQRKGLSLRNRAVNKPADSSEPKNGTGTKENAEMKDNNRKNKVKTTAVELVDEFTKQVEYVEKQKASGKPHLGLVLADAFIRGIRDLGYKSPGTALDELVDNAAQANATIIEVAFGFKDRTRRGIPDVLAMVDNGHGMIAEMIRFAVMWGGTHREGDRRGFGRYGYGLPSAAVSLARRYTVYSKAKGGEWHAVTIDLDELATMAANGRDVEIPESRTATPPAWIDAETKKLKIAELEHGTVVVLEVLDRLPGGWKQTSTLQEKLLNHFGVVYKHLIPSPRIIVAGEDVQPVDPLFLMENARFYDENVLMAQAVETKDFEVETESGRHGLVRIRAACLPANFQAEDPKVSPKRAQTNRRFPIMKEYNGLLICRARRQIDCLTSNPWATFQVYDRNVKIEIDFDPELDEFFGITTSKQQITIAEGMWARLEAAGLKRLIVDLRKKFRESLAELEERISKEEAAGETRRVSELAMAESASLLPTSAKPSPEKIEKAKRRLEIEATKVAETSGKPIDQELEKIRRQTDANPFKLEFTVVPEGPFYRPDRVGVQKKLLLNTAHRFFTDVYESPDATPATKAALEVLLFVLADGELDAEGEFEEFYTKARQNWSMRLDAALSRLDRNQTLIDKAAAMSEDLEISAMEVKEVKSTEVTSVAP